MSCPSSNSEVPREREHARATPLETAAEVDVFQQPQLAIPAERAKHLSTHEDALVAVPVAGDPVAHAVDPGDRAQTPPGLVEEVLERSADHPRVGESFVDQRERPRRRKRVGVQKEQDVATRDRRARVHQLRASRAARTDHPGAARGHTLGGVGIGGGGHDDLRVLDVPKRAEPVERARERVGVVAHGNDDREARRHHRPRARSLAGSTSRHVVHHPVRTVSTNSGGRRSASISRASAS